MWCKNLKPKYSMRIALQKIQCYVPASLPPPSSYFILISALISFFDYYEILYVLENFDKSSSFLDYFLKFSVQLQNVWNHWYI